VRRISETADQLVTAKDTRGLTHLMLVSVAFVSFVFLVVLYFRVEVLAFEPGADLATMPLPSSIVMN
jgi:hypothetical protein